MRIGSRIPNEHRFKTSCPSATNQYFKNRLDPTRNRKQPFVSAHSSRFPADEDGKQGSCRHCASSRDPRVARELRFELLDDAIELVLVNRAGDEVGEERGEIGRNVENDRDDRGVLNRP